MKVCTVTKYDIRTNRFGKQKCIGNFYEKMYMRLLVPQFIGSKNKQLIPEKYAIKIRDKHSSMLRDPKSFIGAIISKLLMKDNTTIAGLRKLDTYFKRSEINARAFKTGSR